jgi:hypothetical protein
VTKFENYFHNSTGALLLHQHKRAGQQTGTMSSATAAINSPTPTQSLPNSVVSILATKNLTRLKIAKFDTHSLEDAVFTCNLSQDGMHK